MVPLHLALRHGSSESVLYELLSACPEAVDAKDDKGRTPLALHNIYVSRAYATKENDPSASSDLKKKNKKRTSALDKFVTIASTNAKKIAKANLDVHYSKKIKKVQEEHSQQLDNLRKLASDEFGTVREKHKELEKKAKSFQLELDHTRKIIKELTEENSSDESRLIELECTVNDLMEAKSAEGSADLQKIEEQEGLLFTLQKSHEQQVRNLMKKEALSEEKASEWHNKLNSAGEEINRFKQANIVLETAYVDLLAQIDQTQATYDQLSLQYEKVYNVEKDLQTEIDEKKITIADTTSLLEVSLASTDRLQEELSLLRQDRNCHQSTILVLSSDLEALAAESKEQAAILDELTNRNAELYNAAETLRKEYEAKCAENQNLTEQLGDLFVAADKGSDLVHEAEKKNSHMKSILSDLTAKLTVKENSVGTLLKENADKQEEIDHCKTMIDEEKERMILDLGHQVRQMSEYELKVSELQQSVESLGKRIEKKSNEISDLRNELEETKNTNKEEHESKDAQAKRMMDALADYAAKFDDLVLTTESLMEQLKSKCQEEETLQSELTHSQNEFVEIAALKESEYSSLMESYEMLQKEVVEINNKVKEMKREESLSQQKIADFSQNISFATSKKIELIKLLKDAGDTLELAENASREKLNALDEKAVLADLNIHALQKKERDLEKSFEELKQMVIDVEEEIAELAASTTNTLDNVEVESQKMVKVLSNVSLAKGTEIQQLQLLLDEKITEECSIREKMSSVEVVKEQACDKVTALEKSKNMAEAQLNEKILASEKKCHEAENTLAELSVSNARDVEKSKWMVLEVQSQLEGDIRNLRLDNERKTLMNQSLQKQVTEITLMIKKETEMLLNLSAKHKKYQDFAESNGFCLMESY
jgi:chromosome segregation ATPase